MQKSDRPTLGLKLADQFKRLIGGAGVDNDNFFALHQTADAISQIIFLVLAYDERTDREFLAGHWINIKVKKLKRTRTVVSTVSYTQIRELWKREIR